MKILKLGAVAGLAMTLAACPDDTRDPATDPAVAPTVEAPAAAPAVAETASLEQVAGSGVTGEVRATPRQNETHLMVMVQNGPPNESLGVRVHSGTCESPGPEIARISAIGTDDLGMGQSDTDVGHAPHLIMDGSHIVAVHRPGADPEVDMPIACATIPQSDMAAQPGFGTQPGATGTMTPGTTGPETPATTAPGTPRP